MNRKKLEDFAVTLSEKDLDILFSEIIKNRHRQGWSTVVCRIGSYEGMPIEKAADETVITGNSQGAIKNATQMGVAVGSLLDCLKSVAQANNTQSPEALALDAICDLAALLFGFRVGGDGKLEITEIGKQN